MDGGSNKSDTDFLVLPDLGDFRIKYNHVLHFSLYVISLTASMIFQNCIGINVLFSVVCSSSDGNLFIKICLLYKF